MSNQKVFTVIDFVASILIVILLTLLVGELLKGLKLRPDQPTTQTTKAGGEPTRIEHIVRVKGELNGDYLLTLYIENPDNGHTAQPFYYIFNPSNNERPSFVPDVPKTSDTMWAERPDDKTMVVHIRSWDDIH